MAMNMKNASCRKRPVLAVFGVGLVLSALTVAGPLAASLPQEGSVFLRAKEEFLERMSREGIVGGALVVLRADRELLEVDHGWANLEKKAPANEATIYDWGSITKLLTSLAVMQLEHHSGLRIDDPVQAHIPAFRNIRNPFRNTDRITLRMLMSHTSGLQEASFLIPLSWDGDWPVWAQIEPNLNYVRVERDPGTGYAYSNFGPMVLGRIIEVVSRDNYETYVDKNLFKPLGMPESYFNRTPYHLKANKAQGYFKGSAGTPRMLYAPDLDQGFTATNGGWKCSIRDFKKFVRFLLGSADPEAQAVYDGILPRALLESMWFPVAGADQPGLACGLGFLIKTQAGQSVIGSSGGANGFVSNMFIHRRSGTAVFMVGNTDNFGDVMRPVRDLLIEALARFPD
jgi:CubicO group peptidase (beta-lactamase class C family)